MKEDKKLVHIFITKYALTDGIIEADVEIGDSGYAYGKPEGWLMNGHFSTKDYFLTRDEALVDCETRRLKKISSLEKQMDKLKKKIFK